jgi:hypothetical protein
MEVMSMSGIEKTRPSTQPLSVYNIERDPLLVECKRYLSFHLNEYPQEGTMSNWVREFVGPGPSDERVLRIAGELITPSCRGRSGLHRDIFELRNGF